MLANLDLVEVFDTVQRVGQHPLFDRTATAKHHHLTAQLGQVGQALGQLYVA